MIQYANPVNRNLKQKLSEAIFSGNVLKLTQAEFDGSIYKVNSEGGTLKLSLKCQGGAEIRANGGDSVMPEIFGDEYSGDGDADCTLTFDLSSLPATKSIKKETPEEEREAIHTHNKEAKEKR